MRHYGRHMILSWLVAAVVAMVLSVYVPHHHHADASCLGTADCPAAHHHTDSEGCGTPEEGHLCCSSAHYIDSRSIDSDDLSPLPACSLAAVMAVADNISLSTDYKILSPGAETPVPAKPVIDCKSLRSPPV